MSEQQRRESAQRHRDAIVSDSGRPVAPKALAQIVSVRLAGEVATALREVASRRGVTVSDLLRAAAEQVVASAPAPAGPYPGVTFAGHPQTASGPSVTVGYLPAVSQTWGCEHLTVAGPLFAPPSAGCGCTMQLIP